MRARFGARADIVAPQAARPCNPFQSNLLGAHGYEGFSWYLGDEPEKPEAASFGDALAALEEFTSSIERPYVVVGCGQGAVLALTLALHALPGLCGVVAIGNGLARLDGWSAPGESLQGIDVVLEALDAKTRRAAATMLAERRATLTETADSNFEPWLLTLAGRRTKEPE